MSAALTRAAWTLRIAWVFWCGSCVWLDADRLVMDVEENQARADAERERIETRRARAWTTGDLDRAKELLRPEPYRPKEQRR